MSFKWWHDRHPLKCVIIMSDLEKLSFHHSKHGTNYWEKLSSQGLTPMGTASLLGNCLSVPGKGIGVWENSYRLGEGGCEEIPWGKTQRWECGDTNILISGSRTGAQTKDSGSLAVERDSFQREGIPGPWHFQQALVSCCFLLTEATGCSWNTLTSVAWAKHSFCKVWLSCTYIASI